ncbi:MAG: pyridoxamine 5'-phosphate oxidase family protein [Candidatus Wolfebacteria bacterium]|nr:pyridoxamine 5'-phosphate oxidase family protein [Candidatus Wolfebacteria bacterium]
MENKQKLFDYLKSQNLMFLSTFGNEISSCPVYYAIDKDFNIYFISEPESKHCQNIKINNQVACSIADSRQTVKDKKIGVQLRGEAQEVSGSDKLEAVLNLWNSTNPGIESIISINNFKNKSINSKAYKIVPEEIKFFNEELYGEEGFKMLKF